MSKKFIIKLAFASIALLGALFLAFWMQPLKKLNAAKDLLQKSSYHLDESTQILAAPTDGYYKATDILGDLQTNLFIGTQASNVLNLSLSNGTNTFVDVYASKIYTLRENALSQIRKNLDSLKYNKLIDQSSDWFYEQKTHYADMLKTQSSPLDSLAKTMLQELAQQEGFEKLCEQWSTFAYYTLTKGDSTVAKLCACDPILQNAQDVRMSNFVLFEAQ
ncbi:MAG: hypothetical protein GY810_18995 [Aureispira sp.]|nr:hypothetical protein [Aureispira sp.]